MKKRFRGNFQLLIRLFNNKHIMFPTEELYSDFYFFGYIHVYQNFGLNYLIVLNSYITLIIHFCFCNIKKLKGLDLKDYGAIYLPNMVCQSLFYYHFSDFLSLTINFICYYKIFSMKRNIYPNV